MQFEQYFTVLDETFIGFWARIEEEVRLVYTFLPVSSDYPINVDFHYRLHSASFNGSGLVENATKELAVVQHEVVDQSVFLKHPDFTRTLAQVLHAMALEPSVASNWLQLGAREREGLMSAPGHSKALLEALVGEAIEERTIFYAPVALTQTLASLERERLWVEAVVVNPHLERSLGLTTQRLELGARKVVDFRDGRLVIEYNARSGAVAITRFQTTDETVAFPTTTSTYTTRAEYLTERFTQVLDEMNDWGEQTVPEMDQLIRLHDVAHRYGQVQEWVVVESLVKDRTPVSLIGLSGSGQVLVQLGVEEFVAHYARLNRPTTVRYEPSPTRVGSDPKPNALLEALTQLLTVLDPNRVESRFTYCLDERKGHKLSNEALNALIQASLITQAHQRAQ